MNQGPILFLWNVFLNEDFFQGVKLGGLENCSLTKYIRYRKYWDMNECAVNQ